MKASTILKWFLPFWKSHKFQFIGLISLTVITIVFDTTFPLFLKYIFDQLATDFSLNYVETLIYALFGFMILRAFVSHALPYWRGLVNMTYAGLLRDELYMTYAKSDNHFFQKFSTGDLITRLTDDIDGSWERLSWYACSGVMRPLEAILSVTGALIVMFSNSIPLTVASFIPIPILIGILAYFEVKMLRLTIEKQEAASNCNDLLESCFTGIKVVKSTNSAPHQLSKYKELVALRESKDRDFLKVNQLMQFLSSVSSNSGVIITIFFGSYLLTKGSISLGSFIMFIIYLSRMVHHIWTLSWFYATTKQMQKYQQRIDETKRNITDSKQGIQVSKFESLEIKNLSFQFHDAHFPLFTDFNLNLKRGEKVAIVGTIGSGKSTIIKLILNILTPSNGKILINNLDLLNIDTNSLNSIIGTIEQEPLLFSETILDNLLLGQNFSKHEIDLAIECAMLSDELKLFPQGLETLLGQKGSSLSGGQKQRLAIARTLLRKPQLILMDDITSAMDAKTEEKFWEKMKQHYPETSMLIITHRQKTALTADRIISLN